MSAMQNDRALDRVGSPQGAPDLNPASERELCLVSNDWQGGVALYLPEEEAVNLMSAEGCRAKALDCLLKADTLDDPRQRDAMRRYAEWWDRLAEYHDRDTRKNGG